MPITDEQLKQIIEAALLAAGTPLTVDKLMALFVEEKDPPTRDAVKAAIKLIEEETAGRGIELKKVSSGYRFQAKQDFAPWVSRLWEEKPARYSRALLETLVLMAYKQPITRGEVEHVRGVAVSTNIIKTLLERDWVKVVGHRDVPGRPALYATTKAFLDYFNLKSLEELPTLAEIRDLENIKVDLELQDPDFEIKNLEADSLAMDGSEIDSAETDSSEIVSEEDIDSNIEDSENISGDIHVTTDYEAVDEISEPEQEQVEEVETLETVTVSEESNNETSDEVYSVAISDEDINSHNDDSENILDDIQMATDYEAVAEIAEPEQVEETLETVTVSEESEEVYSITDSDEDIDRLGEYSENILDDIQEATDYEAVAEIAEPEEEEASLEIATVSDESDDEYSVTEDVDSKVGG